MNNLLSYCGLTDSRMSASDTDLPVLAKFFFQKCSLILVKYIQKFFFNSGELWTNRVMLYYVWDKPGAWSDPANIQSVVIEPDCGTIFEANAYDINADGKENQIIHRLFIVITMYCQASSSQFNQSLNLSGC